MKTNTICLKNDMKELTWLWLINIHRRMARIKNVNESSLNKYE